MSLGAVGENRPSAVWANDCFKFHWNRPWSWAMNNRHSCLGKSSEGCKGEGFKAATCLGWAVQIFQQVGIMLPDHGPGTGTTWWGRTPLPIKSGNVYRHSRLLLNYCPHSYNLLKAWPLLKRSVGPTQFSISARSSQGNIYIYIKSICDWSSAQNPQITYPQKRSLSNFLHIQITWEVTVSYPTIT